jgi:hypothetical protein
MTIDTIKIYNILSEKLGKESAETLTNYIQDSVKETVESKRDSLATKDDIISLQRWMLGTFITLVTMILGLYALILFRH